MDAEQTKNKKVVDEFLSYQDECKHRGSFKPMGQLQLPDQKTGKLIFINSVMCGQCGKQFFQTIVSEIQVNQQSQSPATPSAFMR